MKKLIILPVLLFSMVYLHAQDNMSLLRISGTAGESANPDKGLVSMRIQSQKSTYAEVIEDLSTRISSLEKELGKLKLPEGSIRTSVFNVRANYIYESGSRRQDGYIGTQTLTASFILEKDRLINVVNCAANSQTEPEINIAFDLTENKRKSIREALLKAAVKDARSKAEILATEAGYRIAGVKEINYGVSRNVPSPVFRAESLQADGRDISITPSDLSVSETVDIIFILEKN